MVGLCLFTAASLAAPEVSNIRIGHDKNKTRFVLDINQNIKFNVFTLANPSRVVIDITEVTWKNNTGGAKGHGYIDRYRFGLFKPGTSRIVLDVNKPVQVNKSFMIKARKGKPYRFVIDLKKTSVKAFEEASRRPVKRQTVAKTKPAKKVTIKPERKKKLIVLDPGHGGHDPGNLGSKGYRGYPEKTVALFAAKTIKDELEKTGRYKVILTRDRDVFIKVRSRGKIAHKYQADLFISIHLDSIADKRVRGATVYTLDEKASDREAAALARRENKSDIIAGIDLEEEDNSVQGILIDLVKRETMNLSSGFANALVSELKKVVKVRTRPHRWANLGMLKSLDVPSVLVELGYLTNSQDAKLMMQKETQRKIGRSIVVAADKFFAQKHASYKE